MDRQLKEPSFTYLKAEIAEVLSPPWSKPPKLAKQGGDPGVVVWMGRVASALWVL